MVKEEILKDLKKAVNNSGFITSDIVLSIPENNDFGDYTTNIALQLSKQKGVKSYQNPKEIANEILEKFGHPHYLERVEVAGAGFINFYIKDEFLLQSVIPARFAARRAKAGIQKTEKAWIPDQVRDDKKNAEKILIEYAQPNTHKEFHIGHLRNISIGESLARLLKQTGKNIFKVTYGSDIGLPVAKALWAIDKMSIEYESAKKESVKEKMEFLGKAYVEGSKAYDENEEAEIEIKQIISDLYNRKGDYLELWEETKNWSKDYLNSIYKLLGTEFDTQIWESDIEKQGSIIVNEHLGRVFTENDGAIIFPGEKYGLHTRVFITSAGYPTYEAKEVGLTEKEYALFNFDKSLHIVDTQQSGFFQVVKKALELISGDLKEKKMHVPYGFVSLNTGRMSSRTGNLVTALELIDQVKQEILKNFPKLDLKKDSELLNQIAIGAIKFYFLKFSLISDISFNIKESVSLQGDTGPYLQYTYARTQSLLGKATEYRVQGAVNKSVELESEERELLRLILYFEEIVEESAKELKTNILTEYLISLAKGFNLFYQKYPVLKSKKETLRLALTKKIGETLKEGLNLLGIDAPEKM